MGQIIVEFDNTLEQSDIIIPLVSSSEEEAGNNYTDNKSEIQQTSVYGIQVPLISINNIVIDFDSVIDFSLKSKDVYPSLSMTVMDKYNLISSIDMPGMDNEIRIQILPQFDNVYKKINLTFYIGKTKISGNYITLTGIYKAPDYTKTNYKAFGELNTYDLFSQVAKETHLGFATNVKTNDQDKRFVYCDFKSYEDLLEKEINLAGSTTDIYDYWIDFWNNLNLVNIFERYNAIDNDEDMMIWVSTSPNEVGEGNKVEPVEVVANLSNHPSFKTTELFVNDYQVISNSGTQLFNGTDRVYSIYESNKQEHMDHLIQDGDVKKDIFTKYEYLGEVYGGYNYLLQGCLRRTFLQKVKSEYLQVTLNTPLLGLMRGCKVNFTSYYNDSMLENKCTTLGEAGVINDVRTTTNQGDEMNDDANSDAGVFSVDKAVTGQYLIIGCDIKYSDNKWNCELLLSRPADQKPKFINDGE